MQSGVDTGVKAPSELVTGLVNGRAVPSGGATIARSIYGDLIQFTDFAIVTAASILVAFYYHQQVLLVEFDFQRYAAAGILGATGVTALLRRDGFYEFDRLLSSARAMRAVVARWSLIILGLIAFAFAMKVSESFSRIWLFTWTGVTAGLLITVRIAAAAYLRRAARAGGAFHRRVAVVGANMVAELFIKSAMQPAQAVAVAGVYAPTGHARDPAFAHPVAGNLAALEAAARNGEIDDVIIALPEASAEDMERIVNRLSELPVAVSILSNQHWLRHTGGEIVRIGGAPMLTLYRRPLEGWGGVVKSLEDIVLGVPIFLAALPIMAGCAIAIRLQGPGPIFFTQQRHGFNNAVFRIYKFRTMTVAEDGDVVDQARKDDARITRVGAFLRKWSLDELPQIINVLKGDMSLVGPRPHALTHNHKYAQVIEKYSGRHKVKPGITGWAQVNGLRGETSENEKMAERVKFDLEYIDNWSLWFDFKILVLTVSAVLSPKNAY